MSRTPQRPVVRRDDRLHPVGIIIGGLIPTAAAPDQTTIGGAVAAGTSPVAVALNINGGATAAGTSPGGILVPVTPGGAIAAGPDATALATATSTIGGAVAAGVAPSALVPVAQGGADCAGVGPGILVLVTPGGATAAGNDATAVATATTTIGGATTAGTSPAPLVPVAQGGADCAGVGPTTTATATIGGASAAGTSPATALIALTIGGALAGGTSPTDSSSTVETPTPGGAVANGNAPTAVVPCATGGATGESGSFTVGVLDDFNRADEGPPPSSSWTNFRSSSHVVSGNAAGGLDAGERYDYWNGSTFEDCEVFATCSVKPVGSDWIGVGLRLSSPGSSYNGYELDCQASPGADIFTLYRVDGGAYTSIGSWSQEYSAGDTIRLKAVGSLLTVYHRPVGGSWNAIGSVTDATYSSGYLYIYSTGVTVRLDDFGGGVIVGPVAVVPCGVGGANAAGNAPDEDFGAGSFDELAGFEWPRPFAVPDKIPKWMMDEEEAALLLTLALSL